MGKHRRGWLPNPEVVLVAVLVIIALFFLFCLTGNIAYPAHR